MKWETAKSEDIGARDEQQDSVAMFVARDGTDRLLVLADGMGGHRGGAHASQAVVETARRVWSEHALNAVAPRDMLQRLCADAHRRINEIGRDMGATPRSTVTLLYTDSRRAHWAHVGDSRLYHFRGNTVAGRSRDHSVVQMLVDMGKITERDMATHPDQNRLTQSLGGDGEPEPDFGSAEVRPGDGFLLCSDGLWEHVSTEEMGAALTAESLAKSAKQLTELAVLRAGKTGDNVSVVVARLVDEDAGPATGRARSKRRPSLVWFGLVGIAALAAAAALVWSLGPNTGLTVTDPAKRDAKSTTGERLDGAPGRPKTPKVVAPAKPEDPKAADTRKSDRPSTTPPATSPEARQPGPGNAAPGTPTERSPPPDTAPALPKTSDPADPSAQ